MEEQVREALDLIGAFYDELLDAAQVAGSQWRQQHHQAVRQLQGRFYQLAKEAGHPELILTPRQRAGKAQADAWFRQVTSAQGEAL